MKKKFKLIFQFAIRDFKQKYITTSLGQFWFFLSPIIMISIYTLIFSDVMKTKFNIANDSISYTTYLIPGILAWTSFSVMINSLTNSFEKKSNLIKKINVPMYVFQLSTLVVETMMFFISILLAILFLAITSNTIAFNYFWLIPIMLLQMIFSFGLGVLLSLFTPFFKDLKVAVPLIVRLWFWITPIVYFKEFIGDKFPIILDINPLFYFIDTYHEIFVYNNTPSFELIFKLSMISFFTLLLAAYLYKKMISTIKDIL